MEPVIALVGVLAVVFAWNRLRGNRNRALELALRAGVGVMFVLTGSAHFVGMRADLIDMVPDWLPYPGLIVTVTGLLELAGAIGMLSRRLAPWAGLGLSLLLVAMFPANVALALSGADLPWWDLLVPRTVMQLVFLAATIGVVVLTLRAQRRHEAPTVHQEVLRR